MKIKNIYIDGFGIYNNQSLKNIADGLVVFSGNNESGKSTLMQFLRNAFYGNKRAKNPYKPVRGGMFGGSIDVVLDDGQQYMLRWDNKGITVTNTDGVSPGINPQKVWLGGLERETYESIFSIGLQELQGLKLLDRDDVRGRFFAAGAGLNAVALNNAYQNIDAKLASLLKQRGDSVISRLLNEKKTADNQACDLEGEDREYAATQAECYALQKLISQAGEELENTNQRLIRLSELSKAREPWAELQILQERAAELEYAKIFPGNGEVRYEGLLAGAEALSSDISAKALFVAETRHNSEEIRIDNAILNNGSQIEALYKERGSFENALAALPIDRVECDRAWQNFLKSLQEIGPDWDEAKLETADISVPVCQQAGGFVSDFADIKAEQRQVDERHRVEACRIKNARTKLAQLEQKLCELDEPELKTETAPIAQEAAAKTIQTLLTKIDNLNTRLDLQRQEEGRLSAALNNLGQRSSAVGTVLPAFISPLLASGVALLAGYLTIAGQTAAAGGTLLFGLLAVWYLYAARKNMVRAGEIREQERVAETSQLAQSIARLEHDIAAIEAAIAAAEGSLKHLCWKFGWPIIDNLNDLNELDKKLINQRQIYHKWSSLKQQVNEVDEEITLGLQSLALVESRKVETAEKLAALERAWQTWLKDKGFPTDVRPEGFEILKKAIENARTAQRHWQSVKNRVEDTKQYIETKTKEIAAVIKAVKGINITEVDVADLDKLYETLGTAKANQERYTSLNQTAAAAAKELATLEDRMDAVLNQFNQLLDEVGLAGCQMVSEVPAFRKMAQDYRDWKSIQDRIDNNKALLRGIAGSPDKELELGTELAVRTEGEIAAETAKLENEKLRLQKVINDSRDSVGRLSHKLEQMRQSIKLDNIRVKQEQVNSLLKHSVQEWLSYAICRGMLEETRAVYERERQPAVIKAANELLKLMTGSRYRIITPAGTVKLEDETGKVKEEHLWSSGLADQVYLAIRLSLAAEFNKASESLPIILDDVLVRFDQQRQAGIIRGLLQASSHQQIFLFTCQQQLPELVRQVVTEIEADCAPYGIYNVADGAICKFQ